MSNIDKVLKRTILTCGSLLSIRERCASLRKLLGSVNPVDVRAILREVGQIERDATKAGDRLPAVGNELRLLMVRLSYQRIITAERWEEFFGEAE